MYYSIEAGVYTFQRRGIWADGGEVVIKLVADHRRGKPGQWGNFGLIRYTQREVITLIKVNMSNYSMCLQSHQKKPDA